MANHSATKKSVRKNLKRTLINKSRKSSIKTCIKKVIKLAASSDKEEAAKALVNAQSVIMKGVNSGVLKKNCASRKVKQLAKIVKSYS